MVLRNWIAGFFCVLALNFFHPTEAALINEKTEIELGAKTAAQLESEVPVSQDAILTAEVNRLGHVLLPYAKRNHLPFSFKVLDDKTVNALAVPGGYLYVYRGLLEYMPEEHLRAAVIGHEIGHVAERHSIKSMEKQLGLQLLLTVAVGNRYEAVQNLFVKTVFSSYSRGDERNSDLKGFEYTTAAGYNPYSMAMALNRLGALSPDAKGGLFSSHPTADGRVETLKKQMSKAGIRPMVEGDTKDNAPYLVDGKWKWPVMSAHNDQGYDSSYRAYAFAGKLSQLERNGEFEKEKVRLVGNALYHGDTYLMAFPIEDAEALEMSHEEYLKAMLEATQNWPEKAKKK